MKLTLSEVLPPSVIPFWKPLMTPDLDPNSDAKILQIVKRKSKSKFKVKSKVQSSKVKKSRTWTFLTLWSSLHTTTTTTINFSSTSRGPTTKCYNFLETSHDPRLRSQLRCKKFANFFATLFCKPIKLTLSEVLPASVIPFWKPLMTPDLDPNSDAKILQIFLQPYFANP